MTDRGTRTRPSAEPQGSPFDARTEALLVIAGDELTKARDRFAPFNSPHEGWAVIREELDELWEHVKANTGRDPEAYEEAIQVAAMALRYAYDLSKVSAWERAEEIRAIRGAP